MEEYTQITLNQWTQWKEDIREKLGETAGNFVYIGYRLKQIRDSGMYGGTADIFEFAEKEYGLGKSTVSRFIAINEKYSEGGNSLELKEEFRGFSSSKLAEMLTLPDSEIQLITEKTTIQEIRELKRFNTQEPGKEQEEAGIVQEQERTPLEKCLIDFFKERKEMLNRIMEHLEAEPPEYKQAAETMVPSGQASHKKGIVFLFLYDWNTGIKYKLMTEQEPRAMSWQDILNMIYGIYGTYDQTDVWADFYKGSAQEKQKDEKADPPQSIQASESVATSQQNEDDKADKESGEVSKDVTKKQEDQNGEQEDQIEQAEIQNGQEAAGGENEEGRENETQETACADGGQTEEPAADPEPADTEDGAAGGAGEDSAGGGEDGESGAGVAPVQPQDEQLEGQMNIQDYPQYMPDAPAGSREDGAEAAGNIESSENPEKTGTEDESAEAAGTEDTGEKITDLDGMRRHIENQKKIIASAISLMSTYCDQCIWDGLIEEANAIITRVESIKNMEEMWNG